MPPEYWHAISIGIVSALMLLGLGYGVHMDNKVRELDNCLEDNRNDSIVFNCFIETFRANMLIFIIAKKVLIRRGRQELLERFEKALAKPKPQISHLSPEEADDLARTYASDIVSPTL